VRPWRSLWGSWVWVEDKKEARGCQGWWTRAAGKRPKSESGRSWWVPLIPLYVHLMLLVPFLPASAPPPPHHQVQAPPSISMSPLPFRPAAYEAAMNM